jgi:hypothetical protein
MLLVLVCTPAAAGGSVPPRIPAENPPRIAAEANSPPGYTDLLPASSAPTTEWTFHKTSDSQHPDGREQQVMWLMNRARLNPPPEGVWLATSSDPDIAGGRTWFGVNTTVLQNEFNGYPAKPPAAFDVRLYTAAKAHSDDLIARDAQDHTGQFTRIQAAGFVYTGCRGNVFAYADSALNAHAAWNIDWGYGENGMQPGRGHRMAIMSQDGNYTNVGLALVYENNPSTQVGLYVSTGNYCSAANLANHYNQFIVGTVWRDLDWDGFYDLNEGVGGVTVTPEAGTFYAITALSGGYAIPVTMPAGSYQVAFSGSGISDSQQVTIGSLSVLLNYLDAPDFSDFMYLPVIGK